MPRLINKVRAVSASFSTRAVDDVGALPAEFDPAFYRATYADLAGFDDAALSRHWFDHGIAEGRAGSAGATRGGFIQMLEQTGSILEIGPLANPIVRGDHVSYFDVLPTEPLRAKAASHGLDVSQVPEITYFSEVADLSVIPDKFDAAVSAHTIEHQPDLVQHLRAVAGLLVPGGRYFLAVPDQRYCFDHFLDSQHDRRRAGCTRSFGDDS